VPGYSIHLELQELVDAGLTPYQATRADTLDAALFLGTQEESGTIEVGKRADLILLKETPLESIAASKTIAGVMLKGKWLPKAELTAKLDQFLTTSN